MGCFITGPNTQHFGTPAFKERTTLSRCQPSGQIGNRVVHLASLLGDSRTTPPPTDARASSAAGEPDQTCKVGEEDCSAPEGAGPWKISLQEAVLLVEMPLTSSSGQGGRLRHPEVQIRTGNPYPWMPETARFHIPLTGFWVLLLLLGGGLPRNQVRRSLLNLQEVVKS